MKRLVMFVMLLASSTAIFAQPGKDYGKTVKTKKTIDVAKLQAQMATQAAWKGVVKGTVKEVCKREGCWLRLDDGSPEGIMVRMKDHEFTVPKDIDGKTVYIFGAATKTTTSVKMLKHYAEDAGKSKEEIDAITAPKEAITIEADGVRVM